VTSADPVKARPAGIAEGLACPVAANPQSAPQCRHARDPSVSAVSFVEGCCRSRIRQGRRSWLPRRAWRVRLPWRRGTRLRRPDRTV